MKLRHFCNMFRVKNYAWRTKCKKKVWHEESSHSVKSVHIWSYSGLYFPAFGLDTDQNNSEYGHFWRSGKVQFRQIYATLPGPIPWKTVNRNYSMKFFIILSSSVMLCKKYSMSKKSTLLKVFLSRYLWSICTKLMFYRLVHTYKIDI